MYKMKFKTFTNITNQMSRLELKCTKFSFKTTKYDKDSMFLIVTSKIQMYKIQFKTMKSIIKIYKAAQKQFSYVKCHIKT